MINLPIVTNATGDVVAQFGDYQRARGFSPKTIKRRQLTLGQFQRLLTPAHLFDATDSDVQEFLLAHDSPRTRHAYRSDLSVFYRWAVRRNLTTNDPTTLVDPIRVPKTLPRPVPAAMVRPLIEYAPTEEMRLAVALAAFAGLRVAEIAHIDADDVDMVRNRITVRNGKGGKDREIPLHPSLRRLLEPRVRKSGRLFQVKPETLSRSVAKYLRESGVDHTCHSLRATFATELAEVARGDVLLVQTLLGHDSPTTSMTYIGLRGTDAGPTVATMYDDCA